MEKKSILFNNFCKDKCNSDENADICIKKCKMILNDFFNKIKKSKLDSQMNSVKIVRMFDFLE